MQVVTLLSLAQMGKFFSHFGMRSLLVLYLIEHFTDGVALGISALFCGLCELGAIFGGVIADRYLGLKKTMLWGSALASLGYVSLFFPEGLYLSMGLIIAGCSLFSGNITAILGSIYGEEDPRRKQGFTFFYMMQNLGALIATLVCGLVASYYGFAWGFALASLGIVGGSLLLFRYHRHIPSPHEGKVSLLVVFAILALIGVSSIAVTLESSLLLFLPWITAGALVFCILRLKMPQLFIYLGAIVLFFAVEDQIASSLLLFAERETSHLLPSSLIMMMNPIVIFLMGTLVAKRNFSLAVPFLLTAASFSLLLTSSFSGVIGVVVLISLAELMVGPVVMSYTSEIAAKSNAGLIMGMIPLAFSLAYQCSGLLSKVVAGYSYGVGFGLMAMLMLFTGITTHFRMKIA